MTLETASFISDLNDLYPEAGTNAGQGDDHIRLIKTALDGSFPNFAGVAMTCTEAELNTLDGVNATLTAAELNILDGVTSTAAELNFLDLTTGAGTGEVSKALVADGSGDIDLTAIDFNNVDIDSGNIDGTAIGAASASTGKFSTLELASGTTANEISIDGTLAGNSDDAIPTEKAVKTYVDNNGSQSTYHVATSTSDLSITTDKSTTTAVLDFGSINVPTSGLIKLSSVYCRIASATNTGASYPCLIIDGTGYDIGNYDDNGTNRRWVASSAAVPETLNILGQWTDTSTGVAGGDAVINIEGHGCSTGSVNVKFGVYSNVTGWTLKGTAVTSRAVIEVVDLT